MSEGKPRRRAGAELSAMSGLRRKLKKFWYRDYLRPRPRCYRRLGLYWLLRYRNYIDRKLILGEPFETRQLHYLTAFARDNAAQVFVDVGTNIGLYSLYLARHVDTLETVVALEPDLDNYQQLCANIFLNQLGSHIRPLNIGASSQRGTVSFLKNTGNSTGTSRITVDAPSDTVPPRFQATEISVEPLDQLLAGMAGQRMIFKIDVEGHELDVVQGMRELLQDNHCLIQMEILDTDGQRNEKISRLEGDFGLRHLHSIGPDSYFINESARFDLPPLPPG